MAAAAPVHQDVVLSLRGVRSVFGERVIHRGVDLDLRRGEILALVGGSGSGKSTLLREMIMLRTTDGGSIRLFDTDLQSLDQRQADGLRRRIGVLFQQGALFGALTVLENVGLPLREHTRLDTGMIRALARMKIAQVGLPPVAAGLYPRELSGGMIKRAALARAMALDPELLFLDEPTSGLDPTSAGLFDRLILQLRDMLGLSVLMVTHDLDSMWDITDRVAVLGDGKIQGVGNMQALSGSDAPLIREYFEGPRARRAREREC